MHGGCLFTSVAFSQLFQRGVEEINRRAVTDERIREALKRYAGRTFVFDVASDAVYVFRVSEGGISFGIHASYTPHPSDMYLRMDAGRAKRLVEKRITVADVLLGRLTGRVEWRNISVGDVEYLRSLFGT